ncbi:MAG: methyltransferase domain-containing protein [bacterium]
MNTDLYRNGKYLLNNPTWHEEDSAWKAKQIIKMMERNKISPNTICEVGCGAGEILVQLQKNMNRDIVFSGYDISPQALELCGNKSNEKLQFIMKDILQEKNCHFDLILMIDLIEHLEDYFGYLREIKKMGDLKILHIPLDLSVQALLRVSPISKSYNIAGHIHYFTKEAVLRALTSLGYEIIDFFYTAGSIDRPARSLMSTLFKMPRRFLFCLNNDFAVRLMGGYSLLVLAR